MRRVFISHPYRDDPEGNKKKVNAICKRAVELYDVLPISPLHLFAFLDGDSLREEILEVCYRLIDICDEVWVYGNSEGCRREEEYARMKGKKVMRFC